MAAKTTQFKNSIKSHIWQSTRIKEIAKTQRKLTFEASEIERDDEVTILFRENYFENNSTELEQNSNSLSASETPIFGCFLSLHYTILKI